MRKKICIVTKAKYDGERRSLGFITRLNNDLYYDFSMLKGNHSSYHKDGSEWRTSIATDQRAVKQKEHIPLGDFSGFYPLETSMLLKDSIPFLPKIRERDLKKSIIFEVDIDRFPSSALNIVLEIIEPNKSLQINEDTQPPPNAVVSVIEDFSPWVIITVLGHEHNLLTVPTSTGFIAKHFNKRYSVNVEGGNYSYEAYDGSELSNPK